MGLSTLISAIEYLEYMEELERLQGRGRQTTGFVEETGPSSNSLHFRRLDSTVSGSVVTRPVEVVEKQRQQQHLQQNRQDQGEETSKVEEVPLTMTVKHPVNVEAEMEETRPKRFSPSKIRVSNGIPSGMLARRRKMHNILEKSRRAQMRGCLNVLKEILPAPTSHPGTPYGRILTTSTTLVNSVKYIKQLQEEGGKLEGEVKRLQEIKKEMEEKLAELEKVQVGGDLPQQIKMEEGEEETEVEIPSQSGIPYPYPPPPPPPSTRSSLGISSVLGPGVTVGEIATVKQEIPSAQFGDIFSTGGSSPRTCAAVTTTTTTRLPPFGSPPTMTPVLCEILRCPPLLPPPPITGQLYDRDPLLGGGGGNGGRREGGSPHGYFYNDANNFERISPNPHPPPTPPPPLFTPPPPIVQFLFVNSFFNMFPSFCSLPGGGGGGCGGGGTSSNSAASSPPPLDYFTQGLSGGGGGCYGGGGNDHNNNRFLK